MAELGSLWAGPIEDPRRYRVDLQAEGLVTAGQGGEGLTYKAVGRVGGRERPVAVKMLTSLSAGDYERVAARGEVFAGIDHPNVLKHLETFLGCPLVDTEVLEAEDFSIVYSVAEWVEGESLASAVNREGPARGLSWVGQVARGVDHLHTYRGAGAPDGVIHRDVKPSNVMITRRGTAVLMDFGIARPHDPDDQTGDAGTYLWQAPEVVSGQKPSPAADAWGVGAVAQWVILGEAPRFEGIVSARERLVHAAREHGLPEPVALGRHIAGLLDVEPANRPTNLARWADWLDVLLRSARWPLGGRRRALAAFGVPAASSPPASCSVSPGRPARRRAPSRSR